MNPKALPFRVMAAAKGEPLDIWVFGFVEDDQWMADVFGGVTPEDILAQLKAYDYSAGIRVHIHSMGGSVFGGMAIYQLLRSTQVPITTRVYGVAASMGSIIAMAGDTIEISTGGLLMVHNPWTHAVGDYRELQKQAAVLEEVRNSLVQVYRKRTGKSEAELKTLMDNETWMSAETAKQLGFVDTILEVSAIAASISGLDIRPGVPPPAPTPTPNNTPPLPPEKMKQIPMAVFTALLALAGLSVEATPEALQQQLSAAFEQAKSKLEEATKALEAAKAAQFQAAAEVLVGLGLVPQDKAEGYQKLLAADLALVVGQLKANLAGSSTDQSLVDLLKAGIPGTPTQAKTLADEWQELSEEPARLAKLIKENPKRYAELYEARFGKPLPALA